MGLSYNKSISDKPYDSNIIELNLIPAVAKGIWKTLNYESKTITVSEEPLQLTENQG